MKPQTLDARQEAILAAAADLIAAEGIEAVTMSALGSKTGLSRPAIYQYFASREHVLGELLINEMADLSNEIDRLITKIEDPLERVRIWIHYSLAHLASAEHRVVRQISIDTLPQDQRGMLRAMHGYFMISLISSLKDLGASDPGALSGLVFGSVASAAKRIDEGSDFAAEAKAVETFVIAGVESAISSASSLDSF
jgi:AcrR family transcriptional regulator